MTQHPYLRLQTELSKIIGALPAESRLPSEPELARQLGVSRATLREAMRSFEGQGMIRRRQGVGTFVIGKVPILDSGLEVLESIETIAQRKGLKVKMGEVDIRQVPADSKQAQALKVSAKTPLTQVSRVIYTDSHPIAYLVDALPGDILSPSEMHSGFSGSVLDLLLRNPRLQLSHSRTDIRAIGADQAVARALQVQRDDVLLHFVAFLYDKTGRIVDYSYSYFLPGYFHFHIIRKVG